ncbi:MAG: exo-beta-N-acetylmuramidase NamZ family protein [Chloroflexota bacterium]
MTAIAGLEVLLREPLEVVRGRRIGLVTNPAAVDREVRLSIDRLWEASGGAWHLTRLFGPEHGVRGDHVAGGVVPDSVDPMTGLPVSSLYGATRKPTAEMLADVDVLMVDLQDVGVRFYTYQVTAANCLEAGAEHGRPVVVLDRPNPIGGVAVEGPPVEPGFESFVGRRGQPIRHGLTMGELARAVNEAEGIGADLTVVPIEGWGRGQWWDETGLPWVLSSPNLPTLDTATVYPGTCLLEGTLLSEGRGTTRPLEIVGAPWVEPYRWADTLNERGLPGVRFRPLWFQPVTSKYPGARCGGVQLHVADRQVFRPVATGIHVIETARRLWPSEFGWRLPAPGAARSVPHVDRLYGSAALRERLDAGDDAETIIASWDTNHFEALRQRVLLYQ